MAHLRIALLLVAAACLAAGAAGSSAPEADAGLSGPRRGLRQSLLSNLVRGTTSCSSCQRQSTLRVRMTGNCKRDLCLWYTDKKHGGDSTNSCWTITKEWSTLAYEGETVQLDPRYDVHWEWSQDADQYSKTMNYSPIEDPCYQRCNIVTGFEAQFDC